MLNWCLPAAFGGEDITTSQRACNFRGRCEAKLGHGYCALTERGTQWFHEIMLTQCYTSQQDQQDTHKKRIDVSFKNVSILQQFQSKNHSGTMSNSSFSRKGMAAMALPDTQLPASQFPVILSWCEDMLRHFWGAIHGIIPCIMMYNGWSRDLNGTIPMGENIIIWSLIMNDTRIY